MNRAIIIAGSEPSVQRRINWISEHSSDRLAGVYCSLADALNNANLCEIESVHIESNDLHWSATSEALLKINSGLRVINFDSTDPQKGFVVGSIPLEEKKQLHIRCFGKLSFSCNGMPILFPTRKSEEILAYLIMSGRGAAMRDEITEALWPGLDSERGTNNFHVNLSYIRKAFKTVGLDDLLFQSKGRYYLKCEDTYCDAWEYDEIIVQLKQCGYKDVALLELASELYRGEYFGTDGYGWSTDLAYRYELSNEKVQYCLYDMFMGVGQYTRAANTMQRLISANPYLSDPYEKCIYASLCGEDQQSALYCMQTLERIYSEDLDEPMPPKLLRLKNTIQSADTGFSNYE